MTQNVLFSIAMREKLREAIAYFPPPHPPPDICIRRLHAELLASISMETALCPWDASASYLSNSCHLAQVFIARAQRRVDKVRRGTLAAQRRHQTVRRHFLPLLLLPTPPRASAQWTENECLSSAKLVGERLFNVGRTERVP